MTKYVFQLDDPKATVKQGRKTYKNGDTFTPPDDWERDLAHEEMNGGRVTFLHKVEHHRRDLHGKKFEGEAALDIQRVLLPVVEVA